MNALPIKSQPKPRSYYQVLSSRQQARASMRAYAQLYVTYRRKGHPQTAWALQGAIDWRNIAQKQPPIALGCE